MAVSIDDIKKLREQTGAGMMAAKKALEEANGDFTKAQEVLRLAGAASAAKKSDRVAAEGVIEGYVHDGRIGVLVEINCETDFVARTEDFKQFAKDVAMQVAATAPEYIRPEDVPAEVTNKELELIAKELEQAGKPKDMIEKISQGKINKFYEQICLVKQPFVKDPDKTIEQLTAELVGKLGENIVIGKISRMALGEK
jgi:elongation factor Ts